MAKCVEKTMPNKLDGGFIYFIRAGRTANVKIGYASNPYRRLDEMQTSSPHPLHLVGYCPGDGNDEFEWHKRWRHLHVRGEWFRLSQELRDAINGKLIEPGSRRYLRLSADWKALGLRQSQFNRSKRPAFMSRDEFEGRHKNGHESEVLS